MRLSTGLRDDHVFADEILDHFAGIGQGLAHLFCQRLQVPRHHIQEGEKEFVPEVGINQPLPLQTRIEALDVSGDDAGDQFPVGGQEARTGVGADTGFDRRLDYFQGANQAGAPQERQELLGGEHMKLPLPALLHACIPFTGGTAEAGEGQEQSHESPILLLALCIGCQESLQFVWADLARQGTRLAQNRGLGCAVFCLYIDVGSGPGHTHAELTVTQLIQQASDNLIEESALVFGRFCKHLDRHEASGRLMRAYRLPTTGVVPPGKTHDTGMPGRQERVKLGTDGSRGHLEGISP